MDKPTANEKLIYAPLFWANQKQRELRAKILDARMLRSSVRPEKKNGRV